MKTMNIDESVLSFAILHVAHQNGVDLTDEQVDELKSDMDDGQYGAGWAGEILGALDGIYESLFDHGYIKNEEDDEE